MIGTVIGAIMIVVITAVFTQDRAAFLISLALWAALCAFGASCFVTSRLMRRRWQATRPRSSPPTRSGP